ncbi:hypothetical protein ACGFZJ_07585 [Streptomyces sp. NPDC048253]|uniref:hypothetical protein n=1 Tax=unclassified Streptomyces TaxID=2593676 RepID=UPI00324353BB
MTATVSLSPTLQDRPPAMAVRDDNDASAQRILAATGLAPADPVPVLPGAPGW